VTLFKIINVDILKIVKQGNYIKLERQLWSFYKLVRGNLFLIRLGFKVTLLTLSWHLVNKTIEMDIIHIIMNLLYKALKGVIIYFFSRSILLMVVNFLCKFFIKYGMKNRKVT